ncbi:maleate cis-trans isomerase family protein [Nioella nitratireducens]|uniref:maleate cis-trans isomerase family protein n=1 Tax=Nioella nitratireducens TaxID=1287720 RepID=UPI0008FCE9E3|nr:Asp/Glu racemase [Nioella nitratireducens]
MRFDYEMIDQLGTRATVGLVVLQSDETIEHDMRRIFPLDGVACYVSRVPSGAEVTSETLARMEGQLTGSARLFPLPVKFDVVGYGCTSGTSVIGADTVAGMVKKGCETKAVTDPLTALIAACEALKITRLAVLSPYVEAVNQSLLAALARHGLIVPAFGSFQEEREEYAARIAPQSIISAAETLVNQGDVEGIFLSCTNLRTLDVIDEIEARTGVPVLSSNQVMGWHMARQAGVTPDGRFGRLMR